MDDSAAEYLDISDVTRRTGLTSRALRFYEARGLVEPLRTASGRRLYDAAQLEQIHRIILLKSAGFSLSEIRKLLDGRMASLASLVRVQLERLETEAQRIAEARGHLKAILSRIDRGEPVSVATLCSLIKYGDSTMTQDQKAWQAVYDKYYDKEDMEQWQKSKDALPEGFDMQAYGQQWKALGDAISAALPLDPASEQAQKFVDQWYALLKPFAEVTTPEIWNKQACMFEDMDQWRNADGTPDPGFDKQVWNFIKAATAARLAAGGTLEPLAPEYWQGKTRK